jgi:phosphoglucomutase
MTRPLSKNYSSVPRRFRDKATQYRQLAFSEADLIAIDVIRRLSFRHQTRPKQAVTMERAVRNAIKYYAAYLTKIMDRAILREHIQSLMADPRYETSTLFRKQVREQIEANPHLFEQGMPTPVKVNGRVQLGADDHAAVRSAFDKEREEKHQAEVKAATDRAAKDSFSVTEPFAMNDDE